MENYDYERVYSNSNEYYWGVNRSEMCLKILALMPPDRNLKVLDIGCGEGKDAVFLAQCGYNVSAFDISDAGVEKAKLLAEKSHVEINVFKANIWDFRLDDGYDILYSSGVLHYIKPELRGDIISNYQDHTNKGGLNVFNVFVDKPFIGPPPENEEHSYFWHSGQILTYYKDWFVEDFSEFIFDCNSSGIAHKHAMNAIFARKV